MAFVVLVGVIVWAGNYYAGCKAAPEASKQTVNFTVPDGASAGDVVDDLANEGLINCSGFVGNLLMRGTGKTDEIRAGDYQLNPGMTLDEIVTVLTTAPKKIPTTSVLIPPGYRLTEIASTLQETLKIPEKAFLDAANSGEYSLEPYLPAGTPTVEGFIWPETNRFPTKGTTADDVITTGLGPVRGRGEGPAVGSRGVPGRHPVPGHGDRLDDREGSHDRRRPPVDLRRDLQPAA